MNVNVAVAAVVPVMLSEADEHVGAAVIAGPVIAQVSVTVPVKLLVGVAVIVEVPEPPVEEIDTEVGFAERVNPGVVEAATTAVTTCNPIVWM